MKYEIKHRYTAAVLYTAELPDDIKSGMAVRAALERATTARANLAGANLAGANLARANLDRANLDGANLDGEKISKAPLSLLNLRWSVLVSDGYLRIGCQRHKHEEWAEFDSDEIDDMHEDAAEFWAQWRAPLLAMCAAHAVKAEETA